MLNVKTIALKIVCLLAGLSSGVGASYLLVEKGLKLPAGILGIVGIVGLFFAYNGYDYSAGGDAYYLSNAFTKRDEPSQK